ncbi:hypothetical protein A2533_04525 [Candidatus Falkowbacteria bacterium RIFOXYD2_FULL_35_9]|uniref:Zinc ABC transporter substrate-binding protein n=1 Tax=Candidatus Falkowbacteria bacterium RIFOXYC2_FULL_36_12 TaxID=1798002 RepID=A0A1F5T028_9BACT|nr:MAG: hypothetical protein A2478_03255 [Candidatus Falkowbacteria bacterium RIFOXYC2_FULL_36_12]OGF33968.1 MAG: hypothetical protein A2223_03260 [Candidatus Falkowbacteria bacterium RIFOXYA2_FULL_35_8]OGF48393.1 MAG: hypothetical protein A2533_04525 [Candidatus Falkowbacteria bacterium RIFOXYD2_FULL_35_9]
MKKLIFGAIFLMVSLLILSGCINKSVQDNVNKSDKLTVAVSIFPIFDIVKQVAGDKIDTTLILSPGSSPHTYEITPTEVKKLQGAELLIVTGLGIDDWILNVANSIPGSTVFDLSKFVKLQEYNLQGANHIPDPDEQGNQIYDPHYWLEPNNAIIIAETIEKKFSELDPENAGYYEESAQTFIDKINFQDKVWTSKLNKIQQKDILVFHDAWGYFADHFGLFIAASFEPFPVQEPTPKYLKELQDIVNEKKIKTIFVEPQLSTQSISALAKDLGVSINVLDPLGGVNGRNSYIELIDFNVNNIYDLLK